VLPLTNFPSTIQTHIKRRTSGQVRKPPTVYPDCGPVPPDFTPVPDMNNIPDVVHIDQRTSEQMVFTLDASGEWIMETTVSK
jgi:hypothetical protein